MLDGSRVLPDLKAPDYPAVPLRLDTEGRVLTPRMILLQHTKDGEFWVSAFLGHDRDFAGYQSSLRMDLFSVANCGWLAGSMTLKGTNRVIYDPAGPAPAAAPYPVGDLDLYMNYLAKGSYLLTLSYFKPGDVIVGSGLGTTGDHVDLLLNDSSILDRSPSVQNAHDASGSPEVIIGPDADVPDIFPVSLPFYPHDEPTPSVSVHLAQWVEFPTAPGIIYLTEVRHPDGTWVRLPTKVAGDGTLKRIAVNVRSSQEVRVRTSEGQLANTSLANFLQFGFRPDRGARYVIESSQDLQNWSVTENLIGIARVKEVQLKLDVAHKFVRARKISP